MAKFIEFEVTGNGTSWENGKRVIGVDDIVGVYQVAPANVKIFTASSIEVTITLSIDKDSYSAPTLTDGRVAEAINDALTIDTVGLKSKVTLPKDDNGAQLYANDIAIS